MLTAQQIAELRALKGVHSDSLSAIQARGDRIAQILGDRGPRAVPMPEKYKKLEGNLFTGIKAKAGYYNPRKNEFAVNTEAVGLSRTAQEWEGNKPKTTRGSDVEGIITHEEIHAYIKARGIDFNNYGASRAVKELSYGSRTAKNESFTRDLVSLINEGHNYPDNSIYYDERKGVFSRGGVIQRVKDRLGVID